MRRLLAVALVGVLVLTMPVPASAYLKFGFRIGDRTVDVRWPAGPIRYFISERDIAGVAAGDLRAAVGRAAATWRAVPGTTLSFEDQGFTIASPNALDGRNTIGFLDRPDLDRVLGATSLLLDASTGALVEADIFLNTRFPWSVSAQGDAGRVDVESVVLHELGHLIGLGHSAIGETERLPSGGRRVLGSGAVMFPIALTAGAVSDRVLQADDVAAAIDVYGTDDARAATGSVQGRVVRDGRGVFGAHLTAFNLETGEMVGGYALNADGDFVIAGLSPGPHVLRVEPLDDADVESFLSGEVDVDFRVTYASRLVVVPRGGSGSAITVTVVGK
jgi:hypothetical protein